MSFLIDSNIIICSFSDEYQYLRHLFIEENAKISEISREEVLGYHGLNDVQKRCFSDIFSYTAIIFPSQEVYNKAIELRQQYNLKLGDSIIAATSLVYDLKLYTRNLKDFEPVKKLTCVNPIP